MCSIDWFRACAQKPVEGIKMIIAAFAIPDTVIMDVTAGTMVTAAACIEMGYKFMVADPDTSLVESCVEDRLIPMVGTHLMTYITNLESDFSCAVSFRFKHNSLRRSAT